jgi:hypothetical protein
MMSADISSVAEFAWQLNPPISLAESTPLFELSTALHSPGCYGTGHVPTGFELYLSV